MSYHKEIQELDATDYVKDNAVKVLDVILQHVANNLEIDIYDTNHGTIIIDVIKAYQNEGIYTEVGKDSFGYFCESYKKEVSFVNGQKFSEQNCFDKLIVDLKQISKK